MIGFGEFGDDTTSNPPLATIDVPTSNYVPPPPLTGWQKTVQNAEAQLAYPVLALAWLGGGYLLFSLVLNKKGRRRR